MSSVQAFGVGSVQSLTDAATITVDMANAAGTVPPGTTVQVGAPGSNFKVTIAGNRLFNFKNMIDGQRVALRITQDGTGSRVPTFQFNGVAALVQNATLLSTAAGSIDLVTLEFDADLGTGLVWCSSPKAFA